MQNNDKKYVLSNQEFMYVILLLKWFRNSEASTRVLQILIDVKIPMTLENREFSILCNRLGYFYDRIECQTRDNIQANEDYYEFLSELEKFEKINLMDDED